MDRLSRNRRTRLYRALAALFLILALAPAELVAAPATKKPMVPGPKPEPKSSQRLPMVFYVATGSLNACGPGCSTWIAAEGTIETGTADRLRHFLRRFPGQPPPIMFNSPGGRINEALAIGRILRQRGITTMISATVPRDCNPGEDSACRALIQQGKPVSASLRGAICTSACAYAFLGGKIRLIAPDTRIGVHQARWALPSGNPIPAGRLRQLHAKYVSEMRAYLGEMGISARLFDIVVKTPHEKIYYLSRSEIADLGIDKRGFAESWWSKSGTPSFRIGKLFALHSGGSQKAFRIDYLRLSCAGPYRVRLIYFRGMEAAGSEHPTSLTLISGTLRFEMTAARAPVKVSLFEQEQTFAAFSTYVSFEALKEAEAIGGLVLESGMGTDSSTLPARITLDGSADLLGEMRSQCRSTFTETRHVPVL